MNQLVPINGVGSVGLKLDEPNHIIPPPAWTTARNVRFYNGKAIRADGHRSIQTPSVAVYGLFPATEEQQDYWVYFGTAKAYGFDGTSSADITRTSSDYSTPAGTEYQWNGGSFNGIPVFTNGADLPQYWPTVDLATKLDDLTSWPSTDLCKVLRPFKNYLIALRISKSGTWYDRMIRWSGLAAPGNMPDWNYTSATSESGEIVLAEGEDALVDGLQLTDYFMVYTANETWIMQPIASDNIFGLYKRFDSVGMLALGCGARFMRRHFVVSQDDIVVHDGTQVQSVATKSVRSWFFNNLSSDNFAYTKVVPVRRYKEMWICFSTTPTAVLDTALIWNWEENTWVLRDLPDVRAVHEVKYPPDIGDITNDGEGSLENDSEALTYNDSTSTRILLESIMYAPPNTTGIYLVDKSKTFAGTAIEATLQRQGLTVTGLSKDGKIILDPNRRKMITGIRPRISSDDEGCVVKIRMGAADTPDGTPTWNEYINFTVGSDFLKCDYTQGRFLAVEVMSDGEHVWELDGYDLEVSALGEL